MLGKVRHAVADAAETLRRLFADPLVHEAATERFHAVARVFPPLAGAAHPGLEALAVEVQAMPPVDEAVRIHELAPFQARLQAEEGWARWATGATVLTMTPLRSAGAAGGAVPPLPRRAESRGYRDPIRRPQTRGALEPLGEARVRRLAPALEAGPARAGLEAMRALPVPFPATDIQRLPKGLWMRYSLQMVRGTGENVRNLEVLGLFHLPRKGVVDLRHDARRGRILVRLGAEAAASPRTPFILVRRRSDGALLSCYLEEA
jgi:hypothetical protein